MRTNVSFRHSAEFVPVSDEDSILAVGGAQWFVSLLQRVPGLQIDGELCQEDWGVVVFAQRDEKKFWIGLSMWPDGEHAWLAHFHHGSFAWLQRLSSSGRSGLQRLVSDVHGVLAGEPAVSDIVWFEERQMRKAQPDGFTAPGED
jgi:hypothetical protein